MKWYRLVIFLVAFCCVSSAFFSHASAQTSARWLGQKSKEFSQGQSPADVLDELAKGQKFTVSYATASDQAEAKKGKLYGDLDGVPVKQFKGTLLPNTRT